MKIKSGTFQALGTSLRAIVEVASKCHWIRGLVVVLRQDGNGRPGQLVDKNATMAVWTQPAVGTFLRHRHWTVYLTDISGAGNLTKSHPGEIAGTNRVAGPVLLGQA